MGTLVMAAISLSIGALFAIQVRVVVIVVISAMALLTAAAYSGYAWSWHPMMLAVKFVIMLQLGYILGANIHALMKRR